MKKNTQFAWIVVAACLIAIFIAMVVATVYGNKQVPTVRSGASGGAYPPAGGVGGELPVPVPAVPPGSHPPALPPAGGGLPVPVPALPKGAKNMPLTGGVGGSSSALPVPVPALPPAAASSSEKPKK